MAKLIMMRFGYPSTCKCVLTNHPIFYKNPLLSLNSLLSPSPLSLALQSSAALPRILPPHSLPFTILRAPRSCLSPFHPSSSLSSRRAFSLSSRRSRSALRACNCALASSACSSSICCNKRSTLSRPLATSSASCCEFFSRRVS